MDVNELFVTVVFLSNELRKASAEREQLRTELGRLQAEKKAAEQKPEVATGELSSQAA